MDEMSPLKFDFGGELGLVYVSDRTIHVTMIIPSHSTCRKIFFKGNKI